MPRKKTKQKKLKKANGIVKITNLAPKSFLSNAFSNYKKNKELNNFKFFENIQDALDYLNNKEYDGPKVVFGSHYIAKYVYNFFDFSFDNGSI